MPQAAETGPDDAPRAGMQGAGLRADEARTSGARPRRFRSVILLALAAALLLAAALAQHARRQSRAWDAPVPLDYGGFRLLYDCGARSAVRYEYSLGADRGTLPRPPDFAFDPGLPEGCAQQRSTASYASVRRGYDRGHLVTSNHMDDDAASLARANYMTNVVPQASAFNQGIWVQAENVAECYRDLAPLDVYGGVVHEDGLAAREDDHYVGSHGIRTPEWFWKAIVTSDPQSGAMRAIAWLAPNRADPGQLDRWLLSIEELERRIGADAVGIRVPDDVRRQRPAATWPKPPGCQLSLQGD